MISQNLLKEWDYDKNSIFPEKTTRGSGKKVWWKCSKGHEWQAVVNHRSNGSGCPYCSGLRVNKESSLQFTHPNLLKEWNRSKNVINPNEISYGSRKKIWWICDKKHEWQATPLNRTHKKSSCPYCSNKKVCEDNCLVTTHPKLAEEWNYSKNKILPTELVAGSGKEVWWKCNEGHEWKEVVSRRSLCNYGCPYCSSHRVHSGNNVNNDKYLMSIWSKKNTKSPKNIFAKGREKLWWKCPKGHEWQARTYDVKTKSYCPICKESKGEKLVSKILDLLKIRYKREYRFKELGQKRFDFALFKKYKRKPFAVIEYHGIQHYEVVDFSGRNKLRAKEQFKQIKIRDKLKKQYCLDNNIKYLEIPYTGKENAKELINEVFV